MARFSQTLNVNALSTDEQRKLQPGQWVSAGQDQEPPGSPHRGRFLGVSRGGVVYVAWMGNARSWRKSSGGVAGYFAALRRCARHAAEPLPCS